MDIPNNLNYRILGEFDVSEIAREISSVDPKVWDLDPTRQNMHGGKGTHKETKSIFMSSLPLIWQGEHYNLQKHFVSEKLNRLTYEIADKLENILQGKLGRSLYIVLPAKKEIPLHRDGGYYLLSVHRCHIPIITNDSVEFYLNGDVINMKAGVCHEINNARDHAVRNNGETDRIHLVMDIIPMSAFK